MTPANVNLLNAVVLIALGLMGYFTSASPSPTAFIPVVFGAILIACTPGVKKHNKAIAHVAVLLTLIILVALVMPLKGAIGRGDSAAILRVAAMIITSALAMIVFIKSFIDARRSKESDAE